MPELAGYSPHPEVARIVVANKVDQVRVPGGCLSRGGGPGEGWGIGGWEGGRGKEV
jgi:hypothetical protein